MGISEWIAAFSSTDIIATIIQCSLVGFDVVCWESKTPGYLSCEKDQTKEGESVCKRERERERGGGAVTEFQICIKINRGTEIEGNRNRKRKRKRGE